MKEASPGGNIAVGPGENGADAADFPYGYYLSRVLATIEANWFKPPGGTGMRCRVTCRIDRTGHLLEAGLDEPSAQPAFDRAALRAVYAAAPFPPLPQGYASPTLTLHLEFGP
ncbi:MAG: TonB C-terminal domain-containing protein [Acidobacteria bacterium]|nr:TonB C-terminal domain-containing protein [Acidobacteriota bacterium]